MQQSTLQPYVFRSIYDKCLRLDNLSSLQSYVSAVFGSPQLLNESFKLNLYRFSDRTTHNVDLDFTLLFYDQYCREGGFLHQTFLRTLDLLLERLQAGATLTHQYMRSYYILLANRHLYDSKNLGCLTKLIDQVDKLTTENRRTLVSWLVDMPRDWLKQTIGKLQKALSDQIYKLLPSQDLNNVDVRTVTSLISGCCRQLQLFYESNDLRPRLAQEEFRNRDVMKYFSAAEQFKLNLKGISILNFMLFPFLLDIDYKNRLLEIETKVQHHLNMQRGLTNMMNGIVAEENKGNNTVINALFLMLSVHRDSLLDDSIEKLSKTKDNLKNPLKVVFIGQDGDDGGGVRKEYFQLAIKEIFNPCRDLFVQKGQNACYHWFNGLSFEAPIVFEFLGMLLGLSIYNTTLLDLKFPLLLYKKLLLKKEEIDCLAELAELEPEFYKSFKFILETQLDLDELELTFEVDTYVFGTHYNHPLKPYGDKIRLCQANKHEYIKLFSEWIVHGSIQRQFDAFKRGFYKVMTGNVIKVHSADIQLFSPAELQRIICGSETLDFHELEKSVRYEGGYTCRSTTIMNLWDILHNLDLEHKKAFLFFVTGSDRAPIQGLSSMKLTIQREADSDNLPCSRTCSSVLLLPDYVNRQKLLLKLQLALQFKQSFGLV